MTYTRRIPDHWTKGAPPPGFEDHPVRFVNYLDVQAFAEWAGKHVLTEAEWEYAARGPEVRNYPWGNDWRDELDAKGKRKVEDRCNWADLMIVDPKTFEPTTVAVETLPEGRSWCGCFHMLGNVAEGTASWFDSYPDWLDPTGGDTSKNPYASYTGGDYVKVIRGGSLADRERLVLRLAARNFQGAGSFNPSTPGNRFKYVGFRCAAYMQPGLDRFAPVAERLAKRKRIQVSDVERLRLAGATATHWTPSGAQAKNHVYVTGRSSAILFAPKKALYDMDEKALGKKPEDVLERTQEETPLILGIFHTDIGIENAQVLDPNAPPPTEKPAGGGRRHRGGKGGPPRPVTMKGKVDAGSYLLGLWHGEVVLMRGNLDVMGFLGKPAATAKNLKKGEAPPASTIEVDDAADLVKCSLWMRLGGKDTGPEEGLVLAWSFASASGALEKAGSWR